MLTNPGQFRVPTLYCPINVSANYVHVLSINIPIFNHFLKINLKSVFFVVIAAKQISLSHSLRSEHALSDCEAFHSSEHWSSGAVTDNFEDVEEFFVVGRDQVVNAGYDSSQCSGG